MQEAPPGERRGRRGCERRDHALSPSPSLAESTRRSYRSDLREFAGWLERRNCSLGDVDARALAAYATELGGSKPGRRPRRLAPATTARKLAAVRSLLRSTLGPSRVPDVPLAGRSTRRLPRSPTLKQTDALLAGLEGSRPLALRNRALFELVYSAGLRSQEAADLTLADVDFEQEAVRVRGKGGKERLVPLGEEAAYWLRRYLAEARPELAGGAVDVLFLSVRGRPLDTSTLRRLVAEPPSASTCVRDAPARGRRRPAHDPGAARPLVPVNDADLQPR